MTEVITSHFIGSAVNRCDNENKNAIAYK